AADHAHRLEVDPGGEPTIRRCDSHRLDGLLVKGKEPGAGRDDEDQEGGDEEEEDLAEGREEAVALERVSRVAQLERSFPPRCVGPTLRCRAYASSRASAENVHRSDATSTAADATCLRKVAPATLRRPESGVDARRRRPGFPRCRPPRVNPPLIAAPARPTRPAPGLRRRRPGRPRGYAQPPYDLRELRVGRRGAGAHADDDGAGREPVARRDLAAGLRVAVADLRGLDRGGVLDVESAALRPG